MASMSEIISLIDLQARGLGEVFLPVIEGPDNLRAHLQRERDMPDVLRAG
jgi:hypothetical protein